MSIPKDRAAEKRTRTYIAAPDDDYVDYEEADAAYYAEAPEQLAYPEDFADEVAEAAEADEAEEGAYEEPAYAEPLRKQSSTPLIVAAAGGAVLVLGLLLFMFLRSGSTSVPQSGGGIDVIVNGAAVVQPGDVGVIDASKELPRAGYLAPDFDLQTTDGGRIKLSDFRGKQPVWINFWATWCNPCKVEMPEMQKIYPDYTAKGVEIIGVDVAESKDLVTSFLKEFNYSWKFALDTDNTTFRKYYSTGIPTHVFVRKDGIVASVVIGSLTTDIMTSQLNKLVQ